MALRAELPPGFHIHRNRVRDHLNPAIFGLLRRGSVHDLHLLDPVRADLTPSYQPEAHAAGVKGMTLLDMIELLADIRSWSEHETVPFALYLERYLKQYGIPEDLANLLRQSAVEFFWVSAEELTEVRENLVDHLEVKK